MITQGFGLLMKTRGAQLVHLRAAQNSRVQDIRCRRQPAIRCESGSLVRRLVLMRHADAEETRQVRDHDRPITPAGRRAAADVARQLRAAGWVPEVLVCSNALRSRQTLEEMRRELAEETADADEHYLGSLYTISQLDGQTRVHLQEIVVAEASPSHRCVLCLGHNKGWEEATSSFAGEGVKLGNCHAALLEGQGGSWEEAFTHDWRLLGVLAPEAA